MNNLAKAWVGLVALSAGTTVVALAGVAPPWAGAIILLFAWAKARLIFLWYLGLSDVPNWRQGILFAMALYFVVLFGLYLAG